MPVIGRHPRLNLDDLVDSMDTTNPVWDRFLNLDGYEVNGQELATALATAEIFYTRTRADGVTIVAACRDEEFWQSLHLPEWFIVVLDPTCSFSLVLEGDIIEQEFHTPPSLFDEDLLSLLSPDAN